MLIDGYYHHRASVRHKEILALLSEGVSVIGCASMGALRAAELHPYGMIGSGVVFEMYRDGVIDSDDEVAVTHTTAPTYRRISVPLVVIRYAVESARQANILSEEESCAIVGAARRLHYSERSWRAIRLDDNSVSREAIDRLQAFLSQNPRAADIKYHDTVDTLARVTKQRNFGNNEQYEWPKQHGWRNRFIAEWQSQFSITNVENLEISLSDTIRYHQIYLDDFPARWQRFALTRVAGITVPRDEELVSHALAAAARHGLTPGSLTKSQSTHWLSAAELARLSKVEALIRILVRSYQPPCQTRDLVDAEPDLATDPQAQRAVAESRVINAEVASWGHTRSEEYLKRSALRAHLAEVWGADTRDQLALSAAARDRGFSSADDAVEAVRPFLLRDRFRSIDRVLSRVEAVGRC
ncbi:TfuA-like protein [Amycolatopsis keratiniphila]|uniref:TfuA-like protein n=1 Tax=Amycolatopsis keratiniphila TaxID=129921 RepID=UPI0033F0C118